MRRKKLFASVMVACFALTLFAGSALAAKTLKVGVLGPFTGPSAKNGAEFKAWECRTEWTKTYVVDQQHPEASDQNPGTPNRPFATIGRAAEVLAPGERVIVKSGVYREEIVPRTGGTGPGAMIGYEAAPGARVLVKGSRVLEGPWERSRNPDESSGGAYAPVKS